MRSVNRWLADIDDAPLDKVIATVSSMISLEVSWHPCTSSILLENQMEESWLIYSIDSVWELRCC
jgi:hypothetical protein